LIKSTLTGTSVKPPETVRFSLAMVTEHIMMVQVGASFQQLQRSMD
jgi:hypothetical protein